MFLLLDDCRQRFAPTSPDRAVSVQELGRDGGKESLGAARRHVPQRSRAAPEAGTPTARQRASKRGGPEAASTARAVVSRWLDGRAHAELHDDACLLVSELVSNSVRHADQPAGAPVGIRVFAVDGVVRVEVEDRGQGPVRRRAADPREGGFGLLLVELLAARWGVSHEHGTRVWFELAARGPGT